MRLTDIEDIGYDEDRYEEDRYKEQRLNDEREQKEYECEYGLDQDMPYTEKSADTTKSELHKDIYIDDKPVRRKFKMEDAFDYVFPKNHQKKWTQKRNIRITKLFIIKFDPDNPALFYEAAGNKLGRSLQAIRLHLIKLGYIADPYDRLYARAKLQELKSKYLRS